MSVKYEGHWPHCKCHLQIYRCKADHHYHLIIGPEDFSWPFWSLDAGLKHVLFIKDGLLGDSRSEEEERWVITETERIASELLALSKEDLQMLGGFRYQEGSVAQAWVQFFNRRNPFIYFDTAENEVSPLICDFVQRDEIKRVQDLSAKERVKAAFSAVKPRTMAEIGIGLKLII